MKKYNFDASGLASTIGKFGLLHKGHEKMLLKLNTSAQERGLKPAIFSFNPSPALFFSHNLEKHGRIQTFSTIYKILTKKINANFTFFIQKFDKNFSLTSPETFIQLLSKDLHVKYLTVGENFSFGKNREGTIEVLQNLCKIYGIELEIQSLIKVKNSELSTTNLRILLQEGKIEELNSQLGFHQKYSITGRVFHGQKLGSKIGFKTANVYLNSKMVAPKFGVYACDVIISNRTFHGIVNIGVKPTLMQNFSPSAEVHLFNFDEDIYGKKIEIELKKFIRNEKKFNSTEELVTQIKEDITYATNF